MDFSVGDYIVPISSGTITQPQLDNNNDGLHGYLFSPSFCRAGTNENVCTEDNKKTLSQNFTASLKPTSLEPQVIFKLPLPLGNWFLSVEAGGYAVTANNPIDADPAHTDLSKSGFYALDFPRVGSTTPPILASKGGTIFDKGTTSALSAFGHFVIIDHEDGYYTRYAHLNKIAPKITKGVHVSQGDFLGCMGQSGKSEGVHLHFQIYHGGQSAAESQSGNEQLRRVRLEAGSQLLPIVEFVAGREYQSTNAAVPASVCGK